MITTTNPDRMPADEQAVQATAYEYATAWNIGTEAEFDEASAALEAVLLTQGSMTPDDAIESIYCGPYDDEASSETFHAVHVTFEDGDSMTIVCMPTP